MFKWHLIKLEKSFEIKNKMKISTQISFLNIAMKLLNLKINWFKKRIK